jgi:DNA primase
VKFSVRYPPQILDSIKTRVNLVEEVRKVVEVKKKGHRWWACCPFHGEKTPSFTVNDDGYYHCFGCGASGDVFTFTMETQGLTFGDTIKKLAQQAGVTLPEPERRDPAKEAQRQDGYKALERANAFFIRNLDGVGRQYLQGRGLSDATIETFGLGFAPDAWHDLRDALLNEGFKPELLRTAGLVRESQKGKGDYDFFRNRVMFPIEDTQGRVVAFGGRVMDKSEPKYLNSGETPFFSKSHTLFNLHRARPDIRKAGNALLVEGYLDVIALYQAGLKTAVAPMGTAVTADQLLLLWQAAPTITVCLDGDSAGRAAARRVSQLALPSLEPNRKLQFLWLPEGDDPDTLVRKDGLTAFTRLLGQPASLEQVLWHNLTAGLDLASADSRAVIESNMNALLGTIRDKVVRKSYSDALRQRLFSATRAPKTDSKATLLHSPAKTQAPVTYRPAVSAPPAQRRLIGLLTRYPHLLPQVDELLGQIDFPQGGLREVAQALLRLYMQGVQSIADELIAGPHGAAVAALWRETGMENPEVEPASILNELVLYFGSADHQKEVQADVARQLAQGDLTEQDWHRFKMGHRANKIAQ